MKVEFADIEGVRTRFFHHGSGDDAILFLHGVGVSSDSWFWNLEPLGDGRVAIAPDMLGFGMTEEGEYREGPPHDHIVKHLVNLCRHFKFRRVAVVGSSFGANIACHLALALPDLVHRLILVGCGPALNSPAYLRGMYEASFENGSMAMSDPTLDRCRLRLERLVFKPNVLHGALLLIQLTLYGIPGAFERYQRRMRGIMTIEALKEYDVLPKLGDIKCPTLIVWGREDSRGILEQAQDNSKAFPQVKFVTLDKCGHLPYLEHAESFNFLATKFIAEGAMEQEDFYEIEG